MTDATPSAERYTHGHHASVVAQHQRRTAEEAAAFLLPHLRPGARLLDFGCGPGTVTTGLARLVAPGAVVGIDVSAEILDLARSHAAEQGVENVSFETADVYALPFEDGSFDVAFGHQVLQHLADPGAALVEVGRVLRPGGIVAVRDADYGTMVHWPRDERIERFLALYHAVAARNGGDADAGRRIPAWLAQAGFEALTITTSTWTFVDREEVANWGDSWAERTTESALASQAIEYGLASAGELAELAEGWREWARSSDALFTFIHVEGLARKAG